MLRLISRGPFAAATVVCAFSAAAGTTLAYPTIASAQEPSVTVSRGGAAPSRALLPLLEKVVWDPEQRGPLLIVAPEMTLPFSERSRPGPQGISSPEKPPEPKSDGSYRLADIGPYFGRQVRTAGKTLTVFAPTTMTVLATHLPKPDPYAGMGANEKLRFFQSLLTPAQWRTLGSEGGIGVGDLDSKQRELFLSLLPNPFIVQPVQRRDNGQRIMSGNSRPETGVTLTLAQRQSVRISLHRSLDWSYRRMGQDFVAVHLGMAQDDGANFELLDSGFGSDFPRDNDTLFGVPLREEAPNRLKPGQLPFSWPVLDTAVSLEGAATVGEMIQRVAARTHVELYCDPRYASLTVYTRSKEGGAVRAGDLLQALCWAVTGTFRRVGAASYVLTDDLEGLGTRHARIQAWATTNYALSQQRRSEVEETLAKAPIGDNVGWSASDPMRPNAALGEKIETYRRKMSDPSLPVPITSVQRAEQSLVVPVTELPAPAQETIRKQLESYATSQERMKNDPFYADHPEFLAPLQPDRVVMDAKLRAVFLVPGMGTVSAMGGSFSSNSLQGLVTMSPRRSRQGSLPTLVPPKAIPQTYKQRALLIAPNTADEAERAVTAAKASGLNEVWIDASVGLPGGAPETGDTNTILAAAIAAGKKANVAVGAVLRLLRVPAGVASASASNLPSDRNIVGETTTEFAVRRAATPTLPLPIYFPMMTPSEESKSLLRRSGWLLPDAPAVQASILKRASALAQTPGLAGIVLRDVAAPGYDGMAGLNGFPVVSLDGAEQMGYTEPLRLAFLRETGLDPIDLSPLPGGRISQSFTLSYVPSATMSLPFFPDYGANPESQRINDQAATELGAKNGMSRWNQFRAARSEAVVKSAVRSIRTRDANLPIWVQQGPDMNLIGISFFDAVEATVPRPAPTARPEGAPHSPQALLTIRCLPLENAAKATDELKSISASTPSRPIDPAADDFTRRLAGMMSRAAPGWGGFVIDLTEAVSLDRALPLLDILPKAAPSPCR